MLTSDLARFDGFAAFKYGLSIFGLLSCGDVLTESMGEL